MLITNGEKRKGRRSGEWGASQSEMVRSMKRQRDGDGEIQELKGHCLFYSFRPLAPPIGSISEQWGLQPSPNSPVTKQEDAERDGEGRHRWREWVKMLKPCILHVHASVKPLEGSSFLSVSSSLRQWEVWNDKASFLTRCFKLKNITWVGPFCLERNSQMCVLFGSWNPTLTPSVITGLSDKTKKCKGVHPTHFNS